MKEALRKSLQVREKYGVHDRIIFFAGFMTGLFTAVIIYLAILML
jgi:hypothetical protein